MPQKLFPNQVSVIQIAQGYFYYCLATAKLSQKISSHGSRGLVHLPNHPTISRLWEAQKDLEAEHRGKEGMVSETLNEV